MPSDGIYIYLKVKILGFCTKFPMKFDNYSDPDAHRLDAHPAKLSPNTGPQDREKFQLTHSRDKRRVQI